MLLESQFVWSRLCAVGSVAAKMSLKNFTWSQLQKEYMVAQTGCSLNGQVAQA